MPTLPRLTTLALLLSATSTFAQTTQPAAVEPGAVSPTVAGVTRERGDPPRAQWPFTRKILPTAPEGPADNAKDVPINTALAWPKVEGAKSYAVYFGDADSTLGVRNGPPDQVRKLPAYQFKVDHNVFLLETLPAAKTFHWHADAILADGTTKAGAPRSFTTVANPSTNDIYAWSIRIANSLRKNQPTPDAPGLRGWNYTEALLLDGLWTIAVRTDRKDDLAFIQKWADRFIDKNGVIDDAAYNFKLYSLDRVRPGPVCLWLYDKTRDERYLKAAQLMMKQLDEQPRTSEGGYWHRSTYKNQMWLDGIYMADVFTTQYAAKTNQPHYFDEAVKQVMLIHKHLHDPKTGLYYHGFIDLKAQNDALPKWANKDTGASPEFWARAIGWYGVAMADILDWLPENHPGRAQILPIFKDLCQAYIKYQDKDSGMWFQIVDKPAAPRNYLESSASIMFTLALAKGAQRGWLPPEYLEHARRSHRAVLNRFVDLNPDNTMDIQGAVRVGTLGGNSGFYDTYVDVPVVTNDPKAVGAFEYLTVTMSELANKSPTATPEFPRRNP